MVFSLEIVTGCGRAKHAGERVIVSGHIPPGMFGGCWGHYSKDYEGLLSRYADVLAGQLFGHQHSGSFRILRTGSEYLGSPFAVAHVTPSFSPYQVFLQLRKNKRLEGSDSERTDIQIDRQSGCIPLLLD